VDNTKSFDDVGETWYTDAVDFATSHDLFNGTGNGKFSPNSDMSRAMLVTVLYRLEDEPEIVAGSDYGDVKADSYYEAAVAWGTDTGLVNGYGNGKFGTDDSITRQQLATFLYRYAQQQGLDVSATGDLSGYTDGGDTASWASDAMKWAVGAGIITGKGNGIVDPQGTASRAEVATMLQRLVALMVK
jgi:hypothetical protein